MSLHCIYMVWALLSTGKFEHLLKREIRNPSLSGRDGALRRPYPVVEGRKKAEIRRPKGGNWETVVVWAGCEFGDCLLQGSVGATPLGLKTLGTSTQGSSFLATLSWRAQSLWDCRHVGVYSATACRNRVLDELVSPSKFGFRPSAIGFRRIGVILLSCRRARRRGS
jgi:hypothetical protein